ncbi:hypothetical protein GF362_06045 [Candidatus Dojkabacteria bacterium]|nr:hypothetical protein [Candidatus Dojkabacteria bacterium]
MISKEDVTNELEMFGSIDRDTMYILFGVPDDEYINNGVTYIYKQADGSIVMFVFDNDMKDAEVLHVRKDGFEETWN